jgi:hypothetical protein
MQRDAASEREAGTRGWWKIQMTGVESMATVLGLASTTSRGKDTSAGIFGKRY